MRALLAALGIPIVLACDRSPSVADSAVTMTKTQAVSCVSERAGALVVSNDSVGRFAIATATMGEVAASCAAVDTAYESMCCYMALLVHLRQPGVAVRAEQAEKPNESHDRIVPTAPVREFEVKGDSVRLQDGGPLLTTVADLARRFGEGYVDNPDHDDNDGPQLVLCAMPNLSFRVGEFGANVPKQWRADTSDRNARTSVQAVLTFPRQSSFQDYCRRNVASLPPGD